MTILPEVIANSSARGGPAFGWNSRSSTTEEEKQFQHTSDGDPSKDTPGVGEYTLPVWRNWKILIGILLFAAALFITYKLGRNQVPPEPGQGQILPLPTSTLTPTLIPSLTADWKTYTNKEYGFKIKYPPILAPEEVRIQNTASVMFFTPQQQEHKLKGIIAEEAKTNISVIAIPTIERTLNQELERSKSNLPLNLKETEIFVDGIEAYRLSGELEQFNTKLKGKTVIFKRGNYLYNVGMNWLPEDEELAETFNIMLSTFRFIDEEDFGEKVFCKDPRPEVCTMECINNPPYICGPDRTYCSVCQACSDPEVEWYVVQDAPCGLGDAATKEECEIKGGVWDKWGLLGAEYCQIPSSDGGKPCLDGSECSLGGCISVSGELPGQCTRFKNIFGCFSFVENGEAGEIICVD